MSHREFIRINGSCRTLTCCCSVSVIGCFQNSRPCVDSGRAKECVQWSHSYDPENNIKVRSMTWKFQGLLSHRQPIFCHSGACVWPCRRTALCISQSLHWSLGYSKAINIRHKIANKFALVARRLGGLSIGRFTES